MGQHSFTGKCNNNTPNTLHSPSLSLSAGMSVKDKLSDYLTEIKFHTAPSSIKKLPEQDLHCRYIYSGQGNYSTISVQSKFSQ